MLSVQLYDSNSWKVTTKVTTFGFDDRDKDESSKKRTRCIVDFVAFPRMQRRIASRGTIRDSGYNRCVENKW